MAFAVKKLSGEPIVIVNVDLPVHEYEQGLKVLQQQLSQLAAEHNNRLCVVVDARTLDLSFSDILLLIDCSRDHRDGSLADMRLHFWLAGSHPLLDILIKHTQQQFSTDIRRFESLDLALTAARSTW